MYNPEMYKVVDTHFPRYSPLSYFNYGPDVTIRFLRNWEISAAFRYGQVSTKGANFAFLPVAVYRKIKNDIKVYDIYGSIGYTIIEYLGIFVGMRTELFNTVSYYKHIELTEANVYITTIKGKTLNFTPELGVTIPIKISDFFSILITASGTFQSGSEKNEFKRSYDKWGPQQVFTRIPTGRYYALGANASAGVTVTIPKTSISVSLGGFYRYHKYYQKKIDRGFFVFEGSDDHTLGAVCSAEYTFSFGNENRHKVWIPRPNSD